MYTDSILMDLLTVKSLLANKLRTGINLLNHNSSSGRNFGCPCYIRKFSHAEKYKIKVWANQKSVKRLRIQNKAEKSSNQQQQSMSSEDKHDEVEPSIDNIDRREDNITIPSRETVLQACITTSGLIATLGVLIRQVTHVASVEGLPVVDCSMEISFSSETWHLQLIAGLVILISSCRYVLLATWLDFAESSEAANQQVLSLLQPLDFAVVAFLPGISEELLFRGALLPLFGLNCGSAMLVGAFFGILHLGSGRKYSFAIWATFVGFIYGYATVVSSSLIVPMVSHAANNLVGGLLWHYSSKSQK